MVYRLRDCELDPARFELRRGEQTVPVEPQVLEILLYLVAHRDRAVTRTELFETLWRGRVVSESALNSRIKEARFAIGDDGKAQSQIRTLHRTGYRFVGPVETVSAACVTAAPPPVDEIVAAAVPPQLTPLTAPPLLRRRLGLVGATLGLVLAAGAFSLVPRAARDGGPSAAVASPVATLKASAPANGTRSLAVLPFTNLSPDAEQDYFADGVGVELLNVLSRVPDLQVTGRISSSRVKGRGEPLTAVGETLGVAHLLTGSVRRAGERVRITVELIDVASGYQVWSDSYDRQLGDIFDLQDEIAERVATALQVKLGLGESGEIGMTRNVAAYDEFLRGVWQFNDFRPESIPLAVEHMHRAIALDPTFSRAWAYLYCIYTDGTAIVPDRTEEWRRKALEALEHARSVTPESPFVHILSAREEMRLGRLLEARAALDALPSGYWTADRYVTRDVFRGKFATGTGHAQAALEVLERAGAADPLSPIVEYFRSLAYANAGDSANALAASDRGVELGGAVSRYAGDALLVALGTGDRAEIERRVAALPHDTFGQRAISDALVRHLDDPAAGRAELRRIVAEPSPPSYLRSAVIAHWAAYYGDTELALDQLSAVADGAVDEGLLWRPVLREVRKLPGFKRLVRREGLVDYWRAIGWPDLCRPTVGDDFECT
jgi:TolB-like protein/DNA-binding winged helix-turn-helix (wHTH) protein